MGNSRNISFDELKKAVTPQVTKDILQHFNVLEKFTEEADGALRGSCPFHCNKAVGRSFKITADGRAWFSHDRSCQCLPVSEETGQQVRGGNMLDFIRIKTGGSVREAGLLLDELLHPKEDKGRAGETRPKNAHENRPAQSKLAQPESTRNLTFAERGLKLLELDFEHEAIVRLGLEPETVSAFGAGVASKGLMRGRLAFPLKNTHGEVVAYTGFKLDRAAEGPVWLLPKDFVPGLEVLGIDALAEKSRSGHLSEASVVVLAFDMLEAAYAYQALDPATHHILVILSPVLSTAQEAALSALVEGGFVGQFMVLAAPSERSAANHELIDQAVLKLARLAPTKCVLLS